MGFLLKGDLVMIKSLALILVLQVIVTIFTMDPVDITTTSRPEGVGVGVLLEQST